MLIKFWTAIYRGSFISFLPGYVFHILWTDKVGICPICISLAIFCEKPSLLWIKFLCFSLPKSLHLTESLQSPNAFLSFPLYFIYRGMYGLQIKYRRAFFTLDLPLKGRLIDNKYGEAEKVQQCEKNHSPQQTQLIREHIFICNVTSSVQGGREQQDILSPKRKRHPFFHNTTTDVLMSNLTHLSWQKISAR